MATPNYGYEKRQKELAKKQKKAEKLREKNDRKTHGPMGDADTPEASDSDPASDPSANAA